MSTYVISKDYSPYTGLRYSCKSNHSGEDFYHSKLNSWLKEAIENKEKIRIILDGGEDGYGPSFLDESFGNLVYDYTLDIVNKYLEIEPEGDTEWGDCIYKEIFPDWEKNRIENKSPLKSEEHEPWFRYIKGELKSDVWIHKSNDNEF